MASEASAYKLSPTSLGKHHGGRSTEQKTAAHFMADQKAEAGNTGTVFVLFFPPLVVSGAQALGGTIYIQGGPSSHSVTTLWPRPQSQPRVCFISLRGDSTSS